MVFAQFRLLVSTNNWADQVGSNLASRSSMSRRFLLPVSNSATTTYQERLGSVDADNFASGSSK